MLQQWRRADGKQTLYFGRCERAAYPALVGQIKGECCATIDGADTAALDELAKLGFSQQRAEHRYTIPVTLLAALVPLGLRIISAAATELEPLMALDCAIRADVPGSEGWQPDATWFREETYDSPFFDPDAYLVALDGTSYVGLVRIWNGPEPVPRLGMVGVLPGYRRRGLARALIGQALTALHGRGVPEVTAEADAQDAAANALLARLGGTVTGSELELRRG